jgi:hypothetical protein
MCYETILEKEKRSFAELTSNLKLTGKTFNTDGYDKAIRRAVWDLTARTLTPKASVTTKLANVLTDVSDANSFISKITEYFNGQPMSQETFDDWHHARCCEVLAKIQDHYTNSDGSDVHYGKAQKIVNITLKGCYCLDGANQREDYFKHCHMPLDSFTLAWYNRNNNRGSKIETSWSNLEYDNEYIGIVTGIRNMRDPIFADLTPLQKEFLIWPLEIMITTVKGVNDCFGGIIEGNHVDRYFDEYGLSHDLAMARIILGLDTPTDLDDDFVNWLKSIPAKYKKSVSADFLLQKYEKI